MTTETDKSSTSFIYKLVALCENFEEKDTYYGATTNALRKRFSEHKTHFKKGYKCSLSSILFQKYGAENIRIILVETLSNLTRAELVAKEYEYISGKPCLNKCGKFSGIHSVSTITDKSEYHKKYQKVNKDLIAKKQGEKYTCSCGSIISTSNKSYHEKTKKHQAHSQATQ